MTRMGIAAEIRQALIDALAHADALKAHQAALEKWRRSKPKDEAEPSPPKRDLALEALLPVVRGELPLIASAYRFDDLHTALRIAEEFDLELILNHGAEAHRLADRLAARGIPVVVGPSRSFAGRQEAMRSSPDLAARLSRARVPIAFQSGGIDNLRGLLQEARLATSHGLPYEEALKALTLYPARIFGVDDELGSLEVGKSADVVVFDSDPLSADAKAVRVYVQGRRLIPSE